LSGVARLNSNSATDDVQASIAFALLDADAYLLLRTLNRFFFFHFPTNCFARFSSVETNAIDLELCWSQFVVRVQFVPFHQPGSES